MTTLKDEHSKVSWRSCNSMKLKFFSYLFCGLAPLLQLLIYTCGCCCCCYDFLWVECLFCESVESLMMWLKTFVQLLDSVWTCVSDTAQCGAEKLAAAAESGWDVGESIDEWVTERQCTTETHRNTDSIWPTQHWQSTGISPVVVVVVVVVMLVVVAVVAVAVVE